MQPAESPTPSPGSPEVLTAAFRDLHGSRLHGYALLLTLGDRPRAARLAAGALAAATPRLDELRHPERAAAWLRVHLVRSARGSRRDGLRLAERLLALADLGADSGVLAGLAGLRHEERAALIAAAIERLDRRDVGHIVGRDGPGLDRLLTRARSRYARAYAAAAQEGLPAGPVTERVRAVALRAMG